MVLCCDFSKDTGDTLVRTPIKSGWTDSRSSKKKKGLTVFWVNWPRNQKAAVESLQICSLSSAYFLQMQITLMSLASVAISPRAGNLSPLCLPRWPGWRFNFVQVLADYRYLGAAVMENAAQAGSERRVGALIRTAALGRFPRRER